jgi:hypothetical protein
MFQTQRKDRQRLHIAVPVRLRGTADGQSFDYEAWTLNISNGGAALQLSPSVKIPEKFRVCCEDYQFRADAEVVVVWERLLPQRAIGVRLDPRARKHLWLPR